MMNVGSIHIVARGSGVVVHGRSPGCSGWGLCGKYGSPYVSVAKVCGEAVQVEKSGLSGPTSRLSGPKSGYRAKSPGQKSG